VLGHGKVTLHFPLVDGDVFLQEQAEDDEIHLEVVRV
jgi:hypothetical protein